MNFASNTLLITASHRASCMLVPDSLKYRPLISDYADMLDQEEIDLNAEAYELSAKIKKGGFDSLFELVVESHLPVLNLFHSLLIFSKPIVRPFVNPKSLDMLERILIDSEFRDRVILLVNEETPEAV